MNNHGKVVVGGIRLIAPPTWVFHEFDGLVLARRDSRGGSLQLSTAFRLECRDKPTGECCEATLRQWLTESPLGEFHRESIPETGHQFGWADVGPIDVGDRAWYSLGDAGLLLGVYRRHPNADGLACDEEIKEAESILRSVRWEP